MKAKQILSLTLALLLCVGLLTVPAGADGDMGKAGEFNLISTGYQHAAAIDEDGSLWMWGWNSYGQLGNGGDGNVKDENRDIPLIAQNVPVRVMDDVVSVSCGLWHTAAIQSDGSLWMWGCNHVGQLGNGGEGDGEDVGGMTFQTEPVKVMDDIVAVSCGRDITAAIQKDGSLWMCGWNYHGQLGNGTTEDSFVPVKVMDNVIAVSCGENPAAIQKDGSLWVWGRNNNGQLGFSGGNDEDQYGDPIQTVPVKVMDNVSAASSGLGFTAAIDTDGVLWIWGVGNDCGQLGNGTVEPSTTPVKVLDNVAAVGCGYNHFAAIRDDGSLWMWGFNGDGALGNDCVGNSEITFPDSDPDQSYPIQTTPIKVLDGVSTVSLGASQSVAFKADGTLWTWGWNGDNGALGYEGGNSFAGDNQPIQTVPRQVDGIVNSKVEVIGTASEEQNNEAPDESSPTEDEEASTGRREEKESGEFPILPVLAGVCSVICVGAIATAVILIVKKRK